MPFLFWWIVPPSTSYTYSPIQGSQPEHHFNDEERSEAGEHEESCEFCISPQDAGIWFFIIVTCGWLWVMLIFVLLYVADSCHPGKLSFFWSFLLLLHTFCICETYNTIMTHVHIYVSRCCVHHNPFYLFVLGHHMWRMAFYDG